VESKDDGFIYHKRKLGREPGNCTNKDVVSMDTKIFYKCIDVFLFVLFNSIIFEMYIGI